MSETDPPVAAGPAERAIPEEIARFMASGLSIAVATCDVDLTPHGARACAATVDDDRRHVTVFVESRCARDVLRDLEQHPRAAVLFVRPTDDKACQLKGTFVSSRRARASERAEVERQGAGFVTELAAIGISRELMGSWTFWPCVALRIRASELFDQAPGPGAGAPL